MDNIEEQIDNMVFDFSTIEEEVDLPDLKDDPDKTIDLSEIVKDVKEEVGE